MGFGMCIDIVLYVKHVRINITFLVVPININMWELQITISIRIGESK